jgi:hypothetical protein
MSPVGAAGLVEGTKGVAGGRRRLQGDEVAGEFASLSLVSFGPWSDDDPRERRSGCVPSGALELSGELG